MKKTNVAKSAATFVGRERDLAAIASLFDDGARLITLLGPGGMGKTRTALRFVESTLTEENAGGGGAWMCDLAPARTIAEAAAVIASVLGVRFARDPADLARALARRGRLLLLLDNFESILPDGAALATALLRAPSVSLLVTSRVALGVTGEHRWTLEPIAEAPAIQLFIERAQQISADFRAGPAERAAIADIVRRVDGIPLAIELAAARTSVLSPAQVASRLSLPLLERNAPGADRHRSMLATIHDSFALLRPDEQECLVACTVFRGGFDLEAAEAVVSGASVIAQLEGLRARSLLRAHPDPERGGRVRFRIYEPIREFAEERATDPGPRRRHLAYFAALAGGLRDRGREQANLLAAFRYALAEHDPARALGIALAIDPVLRARGQAAERVRLLDAALALPSETPALTAAALGARGHALRQLGRELEASRDLEEARALGGRHGVSSAVAAALVYRGEIVEEASGNTAEARALFEEALALSDGAPRAEARLRLAHAYRREGRLADAERELDAAIHVFRELGDEEGLVRALFEAGVVALFRQQHGLAARAFDETQELARHLGDRQREGAIHAARGTLLQEMGRLDDAIREHEESCAIFREGGAATTLGSSLYYLAGAHLERDQPADARAVANQALATTASISFPRYEALIGSLLAVLAFEDGDVRAAHDLLTRARASAARCATEPSLDATLAIHAIHCGLGGGNAAVIAAEHACDDPRFALRILESAGKRAARARGPSLTITFDAGTLTMPDGTTIDLSRRAPLRRIVMALAEKRRDAPGEALTLDDLIAVGWPGERVKRTAGVNRAHVAFAELRKLGLRDLLVSNERGYSLTSSVELTLSDTN